MVEWVAQFKARHESMHMRSTSVLGRSHDISLSNASFVPPSSVHPLVVSTDKSFYCVMGRR
eukprot:53447-Eustigmatos_ZCMA.PRE.1